MGNPVIIDAVRTPLGKRKGWLAGLHPGQLLGFMQEEVLRRGGVDPELVEQVIGGCVTQAGEQSNDMVRRAWLYPGLPQHTGGTVIDAQCGSGQQAAHLVHDIIAAGSIDVGIACGVEAMSRSRSAATCPPGLGDPRPDDWGSTCPTSSRAPTASPRTAASPAPTSRRSGSRRSRRRASPSTRAASSARSPDRGARARRRGQADRRDPHRRHRPGPPRDHARGPRRPQAVLPDGLHTAGTSSQISDGAAAVLIMDEEGEGPRPEAARPDRTHGLVGSDPYYLLDGPVDATERCSRRPAWRSATSTSSR